jgi:hypothetical protein
MADQETFVASVGTNCSPFHKPLLPVKLSFHRAVFPFIMPQKSPSLKLYNTIQKLLRDKAMMFVRVC